MQTIAPLFVEINITDSNSPIKIQLAIILNPNCPFKEASALWGIKV